MPIKLKLLMLFLALAFIPTIFVSVLTFTDYQNALEANRLSELRDIAALKAQKIEAAFAALKENIKISQSFWNIKKNLPALTGFSGAPANPAFVEARKTLDGQLQPMQAILGLDSIMLLNPEGKLVYSTNAADAQKNFLTPLPDPGQRAFEYGKKRIYFTDIFFHKEQNEALNIFISAPVLDSKGVLIGVIVFDVKMPPIYDLIQNRTGLGKTGETIIGKKAGGWAVYLNPLRHDPDAALKKKIKIGTKTGIPMQKAVQGNEGVGRSIDYMGKEVISAWRYIPSLGWGIVAKIDSEEAFEGVRKLKYLVIFILVIVLVIISVIALSVSRAIAGPISRLAKCAELVGAGNLDCRADVETKDEIGQFARAFNNMITDLKHSTISVDRLNKEIAEREKAEEGARRLAAIVESSDESIIGKDLDNKIVSWNKGAEYLYGYTEKEAIGKHVSIIVPAKLQGELDAIMKKIKNGQRIEHFETLRHKKDGTTFPVLLTVSPIKDSDGKIVGASTIAHDMTERKKLEELLRRYSEDLERKVEDRTQKLKEAQEKANAVAFYARNLIESSLDPLVTISKEGRITDVNEATIKITGVSREKLIGTDFSDYFTEPEKAREGYQQVFTKGFVSDYPLTIRGKGGKLMNVLCNATVYKDDRGNILGIFAAARDVTEFNRLQDKLVRSEKLAIVGKLASSVAHELRNPLGVMKNVVYYLNMLGGTKENPEVKENLDIITQEIENSDRIITDLLEFSRAKTPVFRPEDINLIIKEVLDRVKIEPNVELLLESGSDVPEIEVDALQMHQLFYNLVKNALEAMEKGGRLKIRTELKGEFVEAAVSDTGSGITKENLGKIFDPLFSTKTKGTGLGLSVCATLVERHNGKIEVASEVGKGTTFTVKLPIKRG